MQRDPASSGSAVFRASALTLFRGTANANHAHDASVVVCLAQRCRHIAAERDSDVKERRRQGEIA
jgi:hypothetical protein